MAEKMGYNDKDPDQKRLHDVKRLRFAQELMESDDSPNEELCLTTKLRLFEIIAENK
ncbi:MAG: hypothetical protein KF874_09700 [Rhizobiaceae bacterium]|nr:hypothetical protein [Rhizobiaceae bacterium]